MYIYYIYLYLYIYIYIYYRYRYIDRYCHQRKKLFYVQKCQIEINRFKVFDDQ